MATYNEIRKSAAKSHNKAYAGGGRCMSTGRYASGGRVTKRAPGVTINVIAGGSAKPDMPPAPPPMPMPPPPAPPMGPPPGAPGGTPPIVGNAALGKPAFAKGGRVKSPVPDLPTVPMGGAGSAYARLRMQKRGGK